MKAVMKRSISEKELFLGGSDDVVLTDGALVEIVDQQTVGSKEFPMECYAVKIDPKRGRPYVWVPSSDVRIVL